MLGVQDKNNKNIIVKVVDWQKLKANFL